MKLTNITKKYGQQVVYDRFSCEIPEKKITCFLGGSGCGKTTLLNIIAGVCDYEGQVEKESDRIGYVFQKPLLIPTSTVFDNLSFVLKKVYPDKKKRNEIISETLEKVGLLAEKDKYPRQLSGGMAQRVSLSRAFAVPSELLLMDEPFKGLDLPLKRKMIDLFFKLYNRDAKTTVFVTHDVEEAVKIGDIIHVLEKGKIARTFSLSDKSETDKTRLQKEICDFLCRDIPSV